MFYVCSLSADLFSGWCGFFVCSVPLGCCFSVLLLAGLTEALSMFSQALS